VKRIVLFEERTELLNIIFSELFQNSVIIYENKIPPSLSRAFTSHHSNIFTLILSLSERREGIGVPLTRCSLYPEKASLASKNFLFTTTLLLSFMTLSLSLSGFKRLKHGLHPRGCNIELCNYVRALADF
jgi:hypothetical protein